MRLRSRVLLLVLALVLAAAGAVLLINGLRDRDPEATPTPSAPVSLSADDARGIPDAEADEPVDGAGEDHGDMVRTEPVDAIWFDVLAGTRTKGLPENRVVIPSLYVDAQVTDEGVSDGAMSLPDDLREVGRLESTSALDARKGSTLLAGHVTKGGQNGALFLLGTVHGGARIITTDADGTATVGTVTSVESVHKKSLPSSIFETTGSRRLSVLTCGGPILRTADGRWTHQDNIVVRAVPVEPGE
ncbi:class F sortase [Brachybacterium halotolerans subsp. kimchii]|uniref:class F sortase n=1 Tax=Brachybacterium halotolerans TaxID=2795215 RepID=UPI001E65AFF2|nr:class F sortase [Brachybacterium halotolerans]UEJ84165.1 class F sortase [Brachybacterium halotolerans subsp. kimchii]